LLRLQSIEPVPNFPPYAYLFMRQLLSNQDQEDRRFALRRHCNRSPEGWNLSCQATSNLRRTNRRAKDDPQFSLLVEQDFPAIAELRGKAKFVAALA
jgi:hypothetical protein